MCCSPCSLAPRHLAAACQIPQLAFVMLGSFSSFLHEERQVQCGLAFTVLSLPFQTIYSCCCDSVQRETAQSCVPQSEFWGLPWIKRNSFHRTGKRTEGCWALLVPEGNSPSHMLPPLRPLQIITITAQKKMS